MRKWIVVASLGLAACGSAEAPRSSDPTPVDPAGPDISKLSCADAFTAEKAARGEDCRPRPGRYCPQPDGVDLYNTPVPCDGVNVTDYPIDAAGMSSHYLVLRTAAPPKAIYLALHYLATTAGTFTNVARLQELAKAHDIAVVVPQAPHRLPAPADSGVVGSTWPYRAEVEPVDSYVEFLDSVVDEVRARLGAPDAPLYVAGLSNGASFTYAYVCRTQHPVAAFMAVAGAMVGSTRELCVQRSAPGSVIVHGTSDLLNPFKGVLGLTEDVPAIHAMFETQSGCTQGDSLFTLAQASNTLPVSLDFSAPCQNGRRHYLLVVEGGGHVWPGQAMGPSGAPLGLLGPRTQNFDATLQGYDLLLQASGR